MKKRTLVGALPLFIAVPMAAAQLSFDPAVNYSVGVEPSGIAVGDFNNDGIPDLASTVDNPDRVVLLFGQGGGTFVSGGSVILPNSSSPEDIVAGDLDGDTDIDLAVGLEDFNQIIVLLNQGGGSFVQGGSFATGAGPRGMDIGDHDGDGDLDICVGNRDGNNATVLTNNGSGSFTSATLAAGLEPRGASFGDIDGDGDLDMVVSCHDDRTVRVYRNNAGVFTMTGTLSTGAQLRPEGITCRDFSGDGLADIATAANGNTNSFVTVYLATGGGSFGGQANYPTNGRDSSSIAAGDFNCDGALDVATANADSNNVSVLTNTGAGAFGGATLLAAGVEPEGIVAFDLDGNGADDLANANKLSNNVSVHLNRTCGGGGFDLAINGTCPGAVTLTVSGATPGGTVAFIYAFGRGSVTIPQGNPCAGTTLDLDGSATLLDTARANASGEASVSGNAPAAACGRVFLQALDVATCSTSDVEAL
ncbi:MAG: FG-GAP repeat domain-containing protein [Phycisphaerales bacterium]